MKRVSGHQFEVVQNGKTFRPNRSRLLFRSIKAEMERLRGHPIFYEELGRYAGQAASTVFDKLQKTEHPQIEALLGWLEHLPGESRNRLMNEVCRCLPSLDHAWLSHDPIQVSRLTTLLTRQSGVTLITGSEGHRTFLITALGHSSAALEPDHRLVAGLDRYRPDWHVPVDGVIYLDCLGETKGLRERVLEAWAKVRQAKRSVLILNGVISMAPELVPEIFHLSHTQNIFVAGDEADIPFGKACPLRKPPRLIRVSANDQNQLQLTIRM